MPGDATQPTSDMHSVGDRSRVRAWALLGLVGGLMTITREQLGLLLIIPAAEAVITYVALARARRWTRHADSAATCCSRQSSCSRSCHSW